VIERGKAPLSWMLRKGLGRVPVCNTAPEPADPSTVYPRGAETAQTLCAAWSGGSTCEWLKALELPLTEEADGGVYTDNPVVFREGFLKALDRLGVRIETSFPVETISPQPGGRFQVWSRDGLSERGDALLLATGGERNHGQVLAKELGIELATPLAAYVRLRAASAKLAEALTIRNREIVLQCPKTGLSSIGSIDFSPRGLEGEALSRLSAELAESWKQRDWKVTLEIDWLPWKAAAEIRSELLERVQRSRRHAIGQSPLFDLTEKQWLTFLKLSRIEPETPWVRMKTRRLNTLVQRLKTHVVAFSGMGLPSGERAWLGGVLPRQLNPNELSFEGTAGLYFAGELLDILGQQGGRHLNVMWASGHVAGSAMSRGRG